MSSKLLHMRRNKDDDNTDYYPTPSWVTYALLDRLDIGDLDTCLEPASGGGHMVNVLSKYFGKVTHMDKYCPDPDFKTDKQDFLTFHTDEYFDFIITNPPYKVALEFILHALAMKPKCAAFLCRITFLESARRYKKLFRDNPPSRLLVFVNRVNMTKGMIDEETASAVCYAWFVWDRNAEGTKIEWIYENNLNKNGQDSFL